MLSYVGWVSADVSAAPPNLVRQQGSSTEGMTQRTDPTEYSHLASFFRVLSLAAIPFRGDTAGDSRRCQPNLLQPDLAVSLQVSQPPSRRPLDNSLPWCYNV